MFQIYSLLGVLTEFYFRAKNYMAYDLGFDNENSTAEYTR